MAIAAQDRAVTCCMDRDGKAPYRTLRRNAVKTIWHIGRIITERKRDIQIHLKTCAMMRRPQCHLLFDVHISRII